MSKNWTIGKGKKVTFQNSYTTKQTEEFLEKTEKFFEEAMEKFFEACNITCDKECSYYVWGILSENWKTTVAISLDNNPSFPKIHIHKPDEFNFVKINEGETVLDTDTIIYEIKHRAYCEKQGYPD